jgi:hypothetical protein
VTLQIVRDQVVARSPRALNQTHIVAEEDRLKTR